MCAIEHIRDVTALEKLKGDLERRNKFLDTLSGKLRAARRGLNAELKVARQIQGGLMPSDIPSVDDMLVDTAYEPAADVGGDIYDFIRLDGRRAGVFIGDASGHGLASALVGTLSKMSLYNHSRSPLSTSELLGRMNRDILAHVHASHYLTCVWSVFDFEKMTLYYSRAGHPLPLVQRKDGTVDTLPGDGVFLGIVEDAEFEQKEFKFEKGDRFFFFTDGIFDIFGKDGSEKAGKILGFDKFTDLVRQTAGKPLSEVMPALKVKLSEYRHDDDYTLIITEIL
jgi:serine phosphatase RsbU (regulator of sigma subunit)